MVFRFRVDFADRLAESNISRKKVRRRTQQPNQIIIKKYIQVPTTRKRIRKIQRKSVNGKPVVRPLIIKKIETPSIVIETPNSTKLRKGINFKKLNYLEDAEDSLLEDDDLLNNYGLGYGENGLTSSLSRYDLGGSYKFVNGLDKLGTYGLPNYDSSAGFKSSLLNGYDPLNALNGGYPPSHTNREPHQKKNRIDLADPPEDAPNEIKPRGALGGSTQEQPRNHLRISSTSVIGDAMSGYKRAQIEDRPFGKREDGRYADRFGDKYMDNYADKYESQESFGQSNRNASRSGNHVRWSASLSSSNSHLAFLLTRSNQLFHCREVTG